MQAPAYGHGRTGTVGINGVGRVGRGYIVKFPHPMHFCLRRAKERKHTHKHTAIDGESEEFCFLVFLLSRRCRHQPTAMDGRPQKISTAWEGWEGVILLNFHTPCIFAFVGRKSVNIRIRTRPSTASPKNFVFWFSFLAVGPGTSLRPWTDGHSRYQRGGKGGKGLYC